jgi:drug/metabolite transporter (DMT)-like permease
LALALIFGLLAASLWGATDFMIRVASRRVGISRAICAAQATSLLVVALWIALDPLARRPLQTAAAGGWIAAAVAAVFGLVATVALYRALHKGRVSVVAPVAAGYGAVTTGLSWLTGEQLATEALLGLALLVGGAVLVSIPSRKHVSGAAGNAGDHGTGLGWALVSCLCYGFEFWIQGRFANLQLGAFVPVAIYYFFSTAVLMAIARARRLSLRMPARDAVFVCATGVAAIAGFICLSLGFGTGHVAVVTAVGSVQSAITVGLACLLTGERLAIQHWLGVVAVIGGLVIIRLG